MFKNGGWVLKMSNYLGVGHLWYENFWGGYPTWWKIVNRWLLVRRKIQNRWLWVSRKIQNRWLLVSHRDVVLGGIHFFLEQPWTRSVQKTEFWYLRKWTTDFKSGLTKFLKESVLSFKSIARTATSKLFVPETKQNHAQAGYLNFAVNLLQMACNQN